ncbi:MULTISPECIES: radical SAM family heme chaperone HemW [Flavobacterium]|uniref:radical SAM family heme chaperone HemW n=1 Tax=Flavobacterium TaxID=237 RepID=UPI000745C4FA|nr:MULTISPECIES: radical SAM family heme chaperone HemW [Flavobacterium]OXA79737.1 coproporphyrinogen III oxidase [Flavobacterium columnare NBRC 100251 = ATCC 23463]AMA50198.1 coproporphyrinogen III oxidase [Flavobacterium covae]AND64283.1 coproporphyrinogen III oxidase [Flavobacterium covae]MCJ1807526.1 radical SAM family heme chaperone HemW [Flavobacterium covae]MCJ1808230.1 radical SAM family heme chaperone HemW [Flavobacterium covae]
MSGIYIHIPFCKQACHYCDFYFSTSLKKKNEMIKALIKEIAIRKNEFENEVVETIYFGGGTPSILPIEDIQLLINEVYNNYKVTNTPEITIEANPDDLETNNLFQDFKSIGINRISIGVQSFHKADLQLMNRAHNTHQAKKSLKIATQYFDNISVDLIYGTPGLTNKMWLENIQVLLDLGIPHISSYALTVEPKTALQKFIQTGKVPTPDEEIAHEQFLLLVDTLEKNNFIHYELSNFGKENYFSKNNSAYWLGKKYIGIGPSAHSYNGINRSWNVTNNSLYIKSIEEEKLPIETEILSLTDRYNEYIMTGLRTIWGISLEKIKKDFGNNYHDYLIKNAQPYINNTQLELDNHILKTTRKGKFFCDGIASDLFFLNLNSPKKI